jgi:hypothetical protein
VIEELRGQDPMTFASMNPAHLSELNSWREVQDATSSVEAPLLPLSSISSAKIVMCNETGQWVTYQSDRYGFNNPDNVWDYDKHQLIALGDSFTQGWCVRAEDNFVALIREKLPRTINLGVGSNGPLASLAVLREYLPDSSVENVLYNYYENDLVKDLPRELNDSLLRRYLDSSVFSQKLKSNQGEVDDLLIAVHKSEFSYLQSSISIKNEKIWNRLRYSAKRVFFLSNLREAMGLVFGESVFPRGETLAIFREMRELVKSNGGKLWFVYLPHVREIGLPEENNSVRREILSIMEELDVPVIDLLPTFMQLDEPLSNWPFKRPGHFNELGYRRVAGQILTRLGIEKD